MTDFNLLRRRSKIIWLVFILVGVVFVARSFELQILKHKTFRDYADSQQKSSMILKSKRGSIYDCRGRLLAYDMDAKYGTSYTKRFLKYLAFVQENDRL